MLSGNVPFVRAGARYSNAATVYLDGLAALASVRVDGAPLATKVCFTVYGGDSVEAVARVAGNESYGGVDLLHIGLLVRWASEGGVRSEFLKLHKTTPKLAHASAELQQVVLQAAVAFAMPLPPAFLTSPPMATECAFEQQVSGCSREFRAILHVEHPGDADVQLVRVPGCYVRLSPRTAGVEGVCSRNALSGLLLCAPGAERSAARYAMTHREGLPPAEGNDADMRLHTSAVHVEKVYLDGMVSLYAPGGRAGAPLRSTGNWLYKSTVRLVHSESGANDTNTFHVQS